MTRKVRNSNFKSSEKCVGLVPIFPDMQAPVWRALTGLGHRDVYLDQLARQLALKVQLVNQLTVR